MPYYVKIVNPKPDGQGNPPHSYLQKRSRKPGQDYIYFYQNNLRSAKVFFNKIDAQDWLDDSGFNGEVLDKLSKTKLV